MTNSLYLTRPLKRALLMSNLLRIAGPKEVAGRNSHDSPGLFMPFSFFMTELLLMWSFDTIVKLLVKLLRCYFD